MNRKEFLEFHKQFTDKMRAICEAKNKDYTGNKGESAFANFTRVEAMGIAQTEQGFLTRMLDKVSRLSSFIESGTLHVKDESVEDTLIDLANYSALLAGYLKSKKETTTEITHKVVKPNPFLIYKNGTQVVINNTLGEIRRSMFSKHHNAQLYYIVTVDGKEYRVLKRDFKVMPSPPELE